MSNIPSQTLSLLMTDIEGSTRLWEREPAPMRQAMLRHDALFEETIAQHNGTSKRDRGEGDSRFAVFSRATDAVAAAATFQQRLHEEQWPTADPIRVRIGIHTGEVDLFQDDYYGSTVNRCARLRDLAYGGQVLISLATMQLVRETLPQLVGLLDLGEHKLKDLTELEHVYQLVIPQVPSDFPPIQSVQRPLNNLPTQLTRFVGREREMDQLRRLLLDPAVRLVTLTGPGGTGKTRLALQVASELLYRFDNGVFFVPLVSVREPDLLIPTVAQVIGVRETGERPLLEQLHEQLGDTAMLLVLDNFEQLIGEAPRVAELLGACPRLKVLVTSREALRVRGERVMLVPALDVPDIDHLPPLDKLVQYGAIRLFIERARAVHADFELTADNAAAIAEICRRLDGLPLAIELAAARTRLFAPAALLARLERRLPVLTGGARDLPEHQQTLRSTIAWSYDLLSEEDRVLFRRLSIFSGGFTIEAAEAVVLGSDSRNAATVNLTDPVEILNGLDSLVGKSLIVSDEQRAAPLEPRFRMLDTIREYGMELLKADLEPEVTRRRHAEYFCDLAESAEPGLSGPEQGDWLQRLEHDHENLRSALAWAFETGQADIGLRLAAALWPFWQVRGYFSEGRTWVTQILTLGGDDSVRAKLLTGAGTLAWSLGDYESAIDFHGQALELYRAVGDETGIAFALNNLGAQEVARGNLERASELFEASLERYRALDDDLGVADALVNLGVVAQTRQDNQQAMRFYEEALERARRIGERQRIADTLYNLGHIASSMGENARAVALYGECLALRRELRARGGAGLCLAALASIATLLGQAEFAARLYGAARRQLDATGIPLDQIERDRSAETERTLRLALGDRHFDDLVASGRAMSLEQATDFARENWPGPEAGLIPPSDAAEALAKGTN